jgi:hypothetical protein
MHAETGQEPNPTHNWSFQTHITWHPGISHLVSEKDIAPWIIFVLRQSGTPAP